MHRTPPSRDSKTTARESLTKLLGRKKKKKDPKAVSFDVSSSSSDDQQPTTSQSPVTRSASAAAASQAAAFGDGKHKPVARSPPPSAATTTGTAPPVAMPGSKSDGDGGTAGGKGDGKQPQGGDGKAPPAKPPPPGGDGKAPPAKPPPPKAAGAPPPNPPTGGGTKPRKEDDPKQAREKLLEKPTAKAKVCRLNLDRKVVLVEQTIKVGMSKPSRTSLRLLEKHTNDLTAVMDEFEKAFNDLALIDVPANIDQYEDKLQDFTQRARRTLERAMDASSQIEVEVTEEETRRAARVAKEGRPPTPPPPPPPGSPKGTATQVQPDASNGKTSFRVHKPNDALKPKTLSRDNTPVEFTMWSQRFKAYYTSSRMEILTLNEQQAYFYACIEPQLVNRFEQRVTAATPIFPVDPADSPSLKDSADGSKSTGDDDDDDDDSVTTLKRCMEFLDEEFIQLHPFYNRRLNYYKASRPSGQSTNDWIQDMLRERDECNLPQQSEDEAFVHRILTGINDRSLAKELMKRRDLSVRDLIAEVALWESNNKCLSTTYSNKPGGATANVVSAKKSSGSGKSKATTTQSTQGNKKTTAVAPSTKGEFQCYRCGQRDRDHVCKAKDSTCRKCNKQGHYAGMCKSKLRAKVNAAQAAAAAATTNATVAK